MVGISPEQQRLSIQQAIDLAMQHYSAGRLTEADGICTQILQAEPNQPDALHLLGIIAYHVSKIDIAIELITKALTIKPKYAEAHNSLGNVLREQGKLNEAVAAYKLALNIQPNYTVAHNNLGLSFQDLGQMEEAVASYRAAIKINPDYAKAHFNLGFALLAEGKSKEGLDEYEWRWRTGISAPRDRCFSQPKWDGVSDLKGQTMLLWGEQGPGDMCIWSSCVPLVATQAAHCILECSSKLIPLFARSFPNVDVRPEYEGPDMKRNDLDCHLPLGSLFRHFIPDLTDAKKTKAFLVPDPDRVAYWRNELKKLGSGPFIGISWKSPLMTAERSRNFTKLTDWYGVLSNCNATFVNLQCKDYKKDTAAAKHDIGVTIHDFPDLDLYDDLDDTAALSRALDLSISVSTTAGAITAGVGTPTWMIFWRQSSWNNFLLAPRGPSVKHFERNTLESWDAVFASITEHFS